MAIQFSMAPHFGNFLKSVTLFWYPMHSYSTFQCKMLDDTDNQSLNIALGVV